MPPKNFRSVTFSTDVVERAHSLATKQLGPFADSLSPAKWFEHALLLAEGKQKGGR